MFLQVWGWEVCQAVCEPPKMGPGLGQLGVTENGSMVVTPHMRKMKFTGTECVPEQGRSPRLGPRDTLQSSSFCSCPQPLGPPSHDPAGRLPHLIPYHPAPSHGPLAADEPALSRGRPRPAVLQERRLPVGGGDAGVGEGSRTSVEMTGRCRIQGPALKVQAGGSPRVMALCTLIM